MRIDLEQTRRSGRAVLIGAVITAGLFASIATSGYGTEQVRTDEPSIPVTDLDEAYERSVRACPVLGLVDYPDAHPAVFELTVDLERPPTGTSVPVRLAIEDLGLEIDGTLDESTVRLGLRLTVPIEDALASGECFPDARVQIGPTDGTPDRGNVSWDLSVTADVETAGFKFPWEDDRGIRLEVRP
ncbi:MAG: hypothetical protein O3A10_13930 [Chloroflexi bacterium]|nr:hypothetical protein [Chloroflexota bacterium]MDA1147555.1 hypothetical protein [Chloroflexota bacterium]MQC83075.1 hypothetical protein [Chloroflexota bacterium]PKB56702.1 MAG: hypothetical protein BZY69_00445 [SAR202 cluster bacterium Casp-Chloro-G1]